MRGLIRRTAMQAVAMSAVMLSAAAVAQDAVTITFWNGFTASDRPTVEAIVQAFNESQTDARVEMTIMPWDVMYQRLLPAYSAGEGPTLVGMSADQIPSYASRGVLAPVNDYYESEAYEADQLIAAAVDPGKWQGDHYGVPMGFTPAMMYWNRTLFEEAGIDGPPATWQEWSEAAVALTDTEGSAAERTYGIAIPDHAHFQQFAILLWGNGGGVVSDDGSTSTFGDPASIDAMEHWTSLIIEKQISPVGLSGADASNLFGAGRAAMMIDGPWASTGFTNAGLDFGIAPIPAGTAGSHTLSVSFQMVVDAGATAEEKEAAYAFISFWNNSENQRLWANQTAYPPHRADVPVEGLENETSKAYAQGRDAAKYYLQGLIDFATIDDEIVTPTIQQILNGRGSPEELMPQASSQIQQILDAQ